MYDQYKEVESREHKHCYHSIVEDLGLDDDELDGLDEISKEITKERISQQSQWIIMILTNTYLIGILTFLLENLKFKSGGKVMNQHTNSIIVS